ACGRTLNSCKLKLDPRTAVDSGNDLYRAGVQMNDSKHQRQAQAGPVGLLTRFGAAEESVEGSFSAFFAESRAVIANSDRDVFTVADNLDGYLRAREAQRVDEQV